MKTNKELNRLKELCKVEECNFPLEVLPETIQRIILEYKLKNGFQIAFTASAILAAVGIAIGNCFQLNSKGSLTVSPSLYVAIIGDSGSGKSGPFNCIMNMLKRIFRTDDTDQETPTLVNFFGDFPSKLWEIGEKSQRGSALIPDELKSALETIKRRTNLSCEINTVFDGYDINGKDGITVYSRQVLTICGTLTTHVFASFYYNKKFSNTGFFERFLVAFEDAKIPKRKENSCRLNIEDSLEAKFEKLISELLRIQVKVDADGRAVPNVLQWSDEARRRYEDLPYFMANPLGNNTNFNGKRMIFTAKLSLILQALRYSCGEARMTHVDAKSLSAALAIDEYFHHSFETLMERIRPTMPETPCERILREMPNEFRTKDVIELFKDTIKERQVHKYIQTLLTNGLIQPIKKGLYRKMA